MAKHPPKRQIDFASLILLIIGAGAGLWAFSLVEDHGVTPLVFIPPVIAATVGLSNITKKVAPRV